MCCQFAFGIWNKRSFSFPHWRQSAPSIWCLRCWTKQGSASQARQLVDLPVLFQITHHVLNCCWKKCVAHLQNRCSFFIFKLGKDFPLKIRQMGIGSEIFVPIWIIFFYQLPNQKCSLNKQMNISALTVTYVLGCTVALHIKSAPGTGKSQNHRKGWWIFSDLNGICLDFVVISE